MAKNYKTQNNPLMDDESPIEASRRTWGGGDAPAELVAAKREKIELVPLADIRPDPQQPRRAVPSAVRLIHMQQSDKSLFAVWYDAVGGHQLDLFGLLNGTAELPDDFTPDPILEGFLRLIDLAASIKRDGLTNPITLVAQPSGGYFIETGERRWLAFQLLAEFEPEQYTRIPARIMPALDVWRQATENNARDDLNAIGRARQLSILLMDVIGRDNFLPMQHFEHEQEYYAQVADGEVWRTPRGTAQKIVAAMGLRNSTQLRQYRALLRLPRDMWTRADDENWNEFEIRSTVTGVTVSDDTPPPPPQEAPAKIKVFPGKTAKMEFAGWGRGDAIRLARISKWGDRVVIYDDDDRRKKLDEIGQALMALEEMKRRLGG